MAAVSQLTNEIRQMLYNFGYRTTWGERGGEVFCTLRRVDGTREVVGAANASRFEAILQAYLALLQVLNPGQRAVPTSVHAPLEQIVASNHVTDTLVTLLAHEGYESVLERDPSGYGWRAGLFRHGRPLVYTDYAATKFDALTHSMGFLVEALEARLDPMSTVHDV